MKPESRLWWRASPVSRKEDERANQDSQHAARREIPSSLFSCPVLWLWLISPHPTSSLYRPFLTAQSCQAPAASAALRGRNISTLSSCSPRYPLVSIFFPKSCSAKHPATPRSYPHFQHEGSIRFYELPKKMQLNEFEAPGMSPQLLVDCAGEWTASTSPRETCALAPYLPLGHV